MNDRIRVNIRTAVNTSGIRRERRYGRDKIVVPSATLPDDVIMNKIKYPADEIASSFASLNGTLAPLGHPTLEGAFVSAFHPEGISAGWIGAHNENVRQEIMPNGRNRVLVDKVIDVARAKESDGGRAVLEAIEKGDPIHTSTGLYCNLADPDGEDHEFLAQNIEFDHDAILLGEDGAATPNDGVGMLVNSTGETQKIEVINSFYEDAERQLDWALSDASTAIEKMARVPMMERIKSAIMDAIQGSERETSSNQKETPMNDDQFKELSGEVKALSESMKGIGETIANAVADSMKPVTDHVAGLTANQEAKDATEKAELESKVVKANLLDEETAKATPLNTLKALAEKAKPGKAAAMNGAYDPASGETQFKLPKAEG